MEATLETTSSNYISGADGYWYKTNGTPNPTKLLPQEPLEETKTAPTTYYAVKPQIATLATGDTWYKSDF